MSDRRRRARAGNSLVEFAIILPLFWALFTGMFQFGKSIWLYARIQEAVAAGARYASHVDFDEPGHTFAGRIANTVVCSNPAGCPSPSIPGLVASNVGVTWTKDARGVPATITVSIRSFTYSVLLRTFVLAGKPRVTTRFAGVYKP